MRKPASTLSALKLAAATVAVLEILSTPVQAATCTLTGPTLSTWSYGGINFNWNTAGNWNPVGVPNSTTNDVCIVDETSTVSLNTSANVQNLQLAAGNTLSTVGSNWLQVNGSQISNSGQFQINGGGGITSYLYNNGNTTLSGGGSVALNTSASGVGTAQITNNSGKTLENFDNTIQGEGLIYNNTATLNNDAGGVINANSTGGSVTNTLTVQFGTVNNAGLMEASNSGILSLNGVTINNAGNITVNGSNASVQLTGNAKIVGGTLNNTTGGSLGTASGNSATLDGSTGAGAVTVNGTYAAAINSTTTLRTVNLNGDYAASSSTTTNVYGSSTSTGNIQLNGGGGSTTSLYNYGTLNLSNGGTVALNNTTGTGITQLFNASGATLHNVDKTIQGEGLINNSTATLNNDAGGVINADSSGGSVTNTLTVQLGTVNNAGLMEASNSGILQLNGATVNNSGVGNITVNGPGASVQLTGNAKIVGGTINNTTGGSLGSVAGNTVTLDGSTGAGAVTVNGPYSAATNSTTYLKTVNLNGPYTAGSGSSTTFSGTSSSTGNIQLTGGGGYNTYLYNSGTLTLSGGGTVTLNTTTTGGGGNTWIYNNSSATLDNVNQTIQGEGTINNSTSLLKNEAGGTINANSTGSPLTSTLLLQYGNVTNQGLMEATNSGTLDLNSITVNNGGGNITTGGPSASVRLESTTIQGGTLSNTSGGFLGTTAGYSATLDGSTGSGSVTLNGSYTDEAGASTTFKGAIVNQGNLQINGGGGSNTYVYNSGNVTLSGGGTVSLSTTGGTGSAWLSNNSGANLDNVNNTIQGEGIIYNSGATLVNEAGGTINANSTGLPLASTLLLQFGNTTNRGLMEATNSGILDLNNVTMDNGGGTIRVGASSAMVKLEATTIKGGTLDNSSGGSMGTTAGNTATLDGRASSSGPLTVMGTYATQAGASTHLYGTIVNQGNLQINGGGGSNTYVYNQGNVTLTGGGTVSLSTTTSGGTGSAWLSNNGSATLDNVNNTIQGEGIIYNNSATLVNEAGGTILANSLGAPLTSTLDIQYGAVTNNGTMQANSGNALHLSNTTFTNFSGNTLTGGSYVVNGTSSAGTLQIDALGSSGGEIVNNAAKITLNGANSNFVDRAGLDALSTLAANTTADSSLAITGGRNLTTVGAFSNAGLMNIGAGSTFSVGASGTLVYTQTGGTTVVNGTLDAGTLNIQAGMLDGKGAISGSVVNAGTLAPGNSPGLLTINGDYTQASQGTLDIEFGGHTMGVDFDKLMINGLANLAGTLSLSLINGFLPNVGDIFTILGFTGGHNGMFDIITGLNFSPNRYFVAQWNADNLTLVTEGTSGVPEPSTLWLLGVGLFAIRPFRRGLARTLRN